MSMFSWHIYIVYTSYEDLPLWKWCQAGTGEGVDCNIRLVSPGCDEGLQQLEKIWRYFSFLLWNRSGSLQRRCQESEGGQERQTLKLWNINTSQTYQKAKLHIAQHEKHMELCRPGSLAAEDRFRFRILKGHQACHIQQKTCDKPKKNTTIMQDHERSQKRPVSITVLQVFIVSEIVPLLSSWFLCFPLSSPTTRSW